MERLFDWYCATIKERIDGASRDSQWLKSGGDPSWIRQNYLPTEGIPIFECSGITKFLETCLTEWDVFKFNLAPPFDEFFVEYCRPGTGPIPFFQDGVWFRSFKYDLGWRLLAQPVCTDRPKKNLNPDDPNFRLDSLGLARAFSKKSDDQMRAELRETFQKYGEYSPEQRVPQLFWDCFALEFLLDEHGMVHSANWIWKDGKDHALKQEGLVWQILFPALFTIQHLHERDKKFCTRQGPSRQVRRDCERRHIKPPSSYWVLEIPKYVEAVRTHKDSKTDRVIRMHGVRGEWHDYRPESPLFGIPGLWGRFWVPPHVRGNRSVGEVRKDYAVSK